MTAPLAPLEKELSGHAGSQLYDPAPSVLPEDWVAPQPLTGSTRFLDAGPIHVTRNPIGDGYAWEPRFVCYGNYQLFGLALEEGNARRNAVGHQLVLDMDLRLTGTERFHVQFRPLGEDNSGGSFYQFNQPEGYVDRSHAEPDRYWVEAELHSLLAPWVSPLAALDYQLVAGKFPFALHNRLLMNDEMLGAVVSKNNIQLAHLSNLNVQLFVGWNDVDTFVDSDAHVYGIHVAADDRRAFYEATYAFAEHSVDSRRDSHFIGLSRTKFYGPLSLAGRAMFKWGDSTGRGDGQLFVLESNYTRLLDHHPMGVEYAVWYCNVFGASRGWNSIGGGGYNRLRTAFEVNPLVGISATAAPDDTWGIALGAQLFRHNEDESIVPEAAFQEVAGEPVLGIGMRYLRKVGPRTFVELVASFNLADDPDWERESVFASFTVLF
ncbi:MAG: hypothetical protein QF805_13910 [Pirellulaceae bacterium]|jgi:hypothetical protein|nr:hypothetical protein [Pirellulaceae bacterium]